MSPFSMPPEPPAVTVRASEIKPSEAQEEQTMCSGCDGSGKCTDQVRARLDQAHEALQAQLDRLAHGPAKAKTRFFTATRAAFSATDLGLSV